MSLGVKTFVHAASASAWRMGNNTGGAVVFKALGHPQAVPRARRLLRALGQVKSLAIYDPDGLLEDFASYYDITALPLCGVYVQKLEDAGKKRPYKTRPLTQLANSGASAVLTLRFDNLPDSTFFDNVFPPQARRYDLSSIKIDTALLSDVKNYLNPLNFATNFVLWRDIAATPRQRSFHTRVTSTNYWAGRGAQKTFLWCQLRDEKGKLCQQWTLNLPPKAQSSFTLDSRVLRRRYKLGDFTGSLFIHACGIAGHDVIKYALDTYGDDGRALSCNHDANPWPADYYAGMPAPDKGEKLSLFVQNVHPIPIPKGAIGFNIMGHKTRVAYDKPVPPFATRAIDIGKLLPAARFPQQIEIFAGRYFVRPRYQVTSPRQQKRLAHANVERTDLAPDLKLPKLGKSLGKGYIMPLSIPPVGDFSCVFLPTPMARQQKELPLRIDLIDKDGTRRASKYLGRVPRKTAMAIDMDDWLGQSRGGTATKKDLLPDGYGHVEFVYDFRNGGDGDGWLHALARYEQRVSGHRAETIFGAHIYNTPVVYKSEPQSYTNKPPGLTTRLFLRLSCPALGTTDTLCHLLYPSSLPWHAHSSTWLSLHHAQGHVMARKKISIPCGGSRFIRLSQLFTSQQLAKAHGSDSTATATTTTAYVTVQDATCRLFGFHGVIHDKVSFSYDHMFGF